MTGIHDFIDHHGLDLVHFAKGQRKDELTQQFLAGQDGSERVLFVGRAQEKATVTRTERRHDRATGTSYAWLVKATALVNHFYFSCDDADFRPFFLKFCSYFPYNATLCINGHEWATRQAMKAGIGFTALDNGFATIDPDDVARVQEICDRLGPEHIDALLRTWPAVLPHPFTPADRAADHRDHISILQAEFSLTQMLDRPVSGPVFFDQVIRDNLDLGRPDQIGLVLARRIHTGRKHHTPGKFRTRVITNGVTPSLHVDYQHATIKQYHQEGRALRTETTINDTRDFRIGTRLITLPALREVGFTANRGLLHVQTISHDPPASAEAFTAVTAPVTVGTNRVAGLRLGDPHAQAPLATPLVFRLPPAGFTHHDLRTHPTEPLGATPDTWPARRATHDLPRLRLHGLIEHIPHSHRYRLTHTGLHHALFHTRAHDKLTRTGTAHHTDPHPPAPSALRAATRAYDTTLDNLTHQAGLTA